MTPKDVLITQNEDKGYIRINITNGNPLRFHEVHSIQYSLDSADVNFCQPKYQVTKVSTIISNDGNKKKILNVSPSVPDGLPSFSVSFTLVKNNIVRIQVEDSIHNAFKVTDQVFNPKMLPLDGHDATGDINAVLTTPKEGEEFFFEIHEYNNPKNVLYTTRGQEFVQSQFYMKTTAVVNSNGKIFGLGERVGDFFLKDGIYTLWARDEPSPTEDGKKPGKNVYGTHPVYYTKLKSGNDFIAVFDNNAGAQDFIIGPDSKGKKITQIKTSGMTDLFIILNGSIQNVTSEFINLVGKPVMVPEWSLGWHQCRYGYYDINDVQTVVDSYKQYAIPLDAMWTDIDYMDVYRDFTVSDAYFSGLSERVDQWRMDDNIHYVPILDAALAYQEGSSNTAYARGKKADVFIKDPVDPTKPFVGKVWPGSAVYMDWLKDNAQQFWVNEMGEFFQKLHFDGMWIDMNEASNFCDGTCSKYNRVPKPIQDYLFYTPGGRDLNVKSISIDALHHDGTTEFEAHSLYGFYMSKATSSFFSDSQKKRPFVITRSSYTGVGKYASHWLGDNFSTFDMLKYSVGGIYSFNFYGVPVTGADICGFIFDTYPELCARWYALGAFYPFARNHNDKNSRPQEPYVEMFRNATISAKYGTTYTDFFREASYKRYALHRYQYSYLHKASTDGTVYFKPMFYDFPEDSRCYENVERDILLGNSVKLSAMVDQGTSITEFYFPGSGLTWCPIWPKYKFDCYSGSTRQRMAVEYDEILAYIKSGSIIPLQMTDQNWIITADGDQDLSPYHNKIPEDREFMNLANLKNQFLDLGILCDSKYKATGWVRYDDGETLDLTAYTEFKFTATGAAPYIYTKYIDITASLVQDRSSAPKDNNQKLGSVIIYNASQFSFTAKSKCLLKVKGKAEIEVEAFCYTKMNICRYRIKDDIEPDIRDIESIHISSS